MVDISKLNKNFNMEYKLSSRNGYKELTWTTKIGYWKKNCYPTFRDWVDLLVTVLVSYYLFANGNTLWLTSISSAVACKAENNLSGGVEQNELILPE